MVTFSDVLRPSVMRQSATTHDRPRVRKRMMADLPSGTVTFLFTDIEGSTERWEQDRTAMADAVDRHLALLRQAVETHGGVPFKVVGDAVQAAFPAAPQAVAAALTAQQALLVEDWAADRPDSRADGAARRSG